MDSNENEEPASPSLLQNRLPHDESQSISLSPARQPDVAQSHDTNGSGNERESLFIEPDNLHVNVDIVSHVEETSDLSDYTEEPPAKQPRLSSSTPDQDGESCPICLDSWSNSGDHRLVALKCGHLFGYRCVEKWLRSRRVAERTCPTCKSKASIREIRYIYARKLVACDTSEITALQKQVEMLQAEKNRLELEFHKSKMAHQACLQQLQQIENSFVRESVRSLHTNEDWRFSLEKNLEVSREGGCRVLTYNCKRYELLVSQKSVNSLFPGYGVRKVGCIDHKLGQFIHLHPKPIRDIAYSLANDFLLSVSLDGTAKILDRDMPSLTIQAGFPLWSCTWDQVHTQEFFVGGIGGAVLRYDVRNVTSPLQKLSVHDKTPVVSVRSSNFGLLTCQLNSCWLWEQRSSTVSTPLALPVDGPFLSLCYQSEMGKALVSCRPSGNGASRSRLVVCQLDYSDQTSCSIVQSFNGSTRCALMSRACWVTARKVGSSTWAAAYSESDAALLLHGVDGAKTITLPATDPALDICSVQVNRETILATVSENRLRIYKAVLPR